MAATNTARTAARTAAITRTEPDAVPVVRPVGTAALWFGVLAAHFSWTAQLLGSYFAVSLYCHSGAAGDGALRLVLHAITLLASGVTLAAGLISWRSWRRLNAVHPSRSLTGTGFASRDGGRIMTRLGMLLSAGFLLLIVFGGPPAFVLPACTVF